MGESWVTNGTEFPVGPLGERGHLRRLIADAIERSDDETYDETESVYLLNADAVLDALGLEQVAGFYNPHVAWEHKLHSRCSGEPAPAGQSLYYDHSKCFPVYRLRAVLTAKGVQSDA